MNIFSIISDVAHLAITIPMFGVGVVVGALGYRYLLKNDPNLLASLVNDANAALQKVATVAQSKAAAAVPPVPAPTVATAATEVATAAVSSAESK